jgi:DNA polymerase III sliding clamp (beta) subunit (PCNA family)
VRKDVKQTLILYASTPQERDKWIKEISACISALPPFGVSDDKLLRTSKSQAELRTTGTRNFPEFSDYPDRAKFKDKFKTLVKGPERTQSEMTLKAKTSKEVSAIFQSVESNESTFTKLDLAKANLKAKGEEFSGNFLIM